MKLIEQHYAMLNRLLPPSRVAHSIRVADAAVRIASKCLPHAIDEIRVAALLHDIAKGCPQERAIDILQHTDGITSDDIATVSVHHALIAPAFIREYFPCFASTNVLSSAFNHTTGAPDMSVFDQIIFVADYVEDGRDYSSCIHVRNCLYDALDSEIDSSRCIKILRRAVKTILELTVAHIKKNASRINARTLETLKSFSGEEFFRWK